MRGNGGNGGISVLIWLLGAALVLGFTMGYFCASENGMTSGCGPGIFLPIETVITEGGLHG